MVKNSVVVVVVVVVCLQVGLLGLSLMTCSLWAEIWRVEKPCLLDLMPFVLYSSSFSCGPRSFALQT